MFTLDAEPGSQRHYKQNKKTKAEVKKEFEEQIAKSRQNENTDMQEKVNGCRMNEDAVKAIQEFEQIIQNKKSDIVGLAYYQGKYFRSSEKRNDLLAIWF